MVVEASRAKATLIWQLPSVATETGYLLIVRRLSTLVTPGADHATPSASANSEGDDTRPVRTTVLLWASTFTCRASISALRLKAVSILCAISVGWGFVVRLIRLVMPLTPIKWLTASCAAARFILPVHIAF